MSDPITAAAIGAGISGGTSLLQGKKLSTSLRDAAIGGALGGAGGYLGGAMGGAGGAAGSTAGTGTGAAATSANLLDDAAQLSGVTAEGLVFNPATGTFLNPQYFAGATSGMPLYTGGGSALSQIGTGLGSLGSQINTGLGNLGSSAIDAVKANPFPAANLGMSAYDRMNASQAPLQPSPMLSAQQLMGQQGAVPTPQFNSLLQPSRRPILIG
jgi:hypothetical protein